MASVIRSRFLACAVRLTNQKYPISSTIFKRSFIKPTVFSYSKPLSSFHIARYSLVNPISEEDVTTRVLNVCKEYEKIKKDQLSLAAHFMKDLGLDSLDHVEVIMAVEDEFGFEIPEPVSEKLFTPKDIVDHVFKELSKK